jgi:release factor glutamine methyltransferase
VSEPTWGSLLREARRRLGGRSLDARRIVERASGYEGGTLVAHRDEAAPERAAAAVAGMVERRVAGEPLQYVVGTWGFRRLDLLVDRRVLIPRPETETVVEVAMAEWRRLPSPAVAVDLGTGSGAIGLSLSVELGAEVWATDASPEALAVARANVAGTGGAAATRVRLVEGDWFTALPGELAGRVDLLVSNPPYVGAAEALPAEVADWEPAAALVSGPTGLEAVAHIVATAPAWLARPGALVLELAPHQADEALALAAGAGFADAAVHPDLAGRPRCLAARAR